MVKICTAESLCKSKVTSAVITDISWLDDDTQTHRSLIHMQTQFVFLSFWFLIKTVVKIGKNMVRWYSLGKKWKTNYCKFVRCFFFLHVADVETETWWKPETFGPLFFKTVSTSELKFFQYSWFENFVS